MAAKSGSGKMSGSTRSGDAAAKDRAIAELKKQVAILENELRLKREDATSPKPAKPPRAGETRCAGEERYRSLIESTGDWVWETDRDFVLTYDSPQGREVLGYGPDEVIGRTPFSFMPEDELERIKSIALPAIARHEPIRRIENRIIRKDGSIATIETTAIPLFDESGRYRGYRGVNHDITERKRIEEALKLTQFALDNFGESAIWITKDGRIAYVNQAACRPLGYSREELLSMHIWDIDPNYPRERILELWQVRMLDRHTKFESVHVARDGRAFPVEVTSCYIRYGDEELLITFDRDITERKRAEEALRESERFLDSIFEGIQEGISILDKDLNIVKVNHAMEKWYSHMLPLAGKKCYQAYHGRTSACAVCPSLRAMKEKKMQMDIVPYINASGFAGWLELYSSPLKDDQGNVTGVIEHVRDITERKRAEEALKESEMKFRVLTETSPAAIFLYQGEKYVYVNPMAEALTGYSREELLTGDAWEWIHPEFQELVKERARKRQLGEQLPKRYEVKYRAKDGREGWVDFTADLVDYQGKPAGLAMAFDVSQRKRAEEALRESEEKYRFLVENSRDLIWKIDLHGRWTFIGGNVESVTGYTPDEIMGKTIWDFIAPECHGNIREKLLKRMRGEDITPYTTWMVNKAGDRIPLEIATTAIVDESGRIVGVQGISRDITLRMRAEKEMKAAKSQAELYLDLMGHDINNMHQVALGYLELARDLPPGEEQTRLLDKPVEVLQRSTQLIQNVRKLQKLKEGAFKTREVDVCGVLRDVQREFGAVPNKAITLNTNGREECLVRANELLYDVFANLVSNAIKHTGDRAYIIIDMDVLKDKGDKYCRVMVEDNGPGIPDDFKSVIFNRALKGTSKARGMGLGLYLVKSLVDSYGGRVWVEDRVKGDYTKGARFVIMLPAIEK